MGEAESEGSSRKRKSKLENPEVSPEKKTKNFCCITFRQELKGSEAIKSLKKFISAAKNSDDVIYDYMEKGGSPQELLSLLDPTATGDLTSALPVFEALHLIYLRFQSSDSLYHQKCIESAKTVLRSYVIVLQTMLSMNVTKQKKVALKVLTATATLDSSFAIEIINVISFSPVLISALIQPSREKESVRKSFILFVLSFLIEGNLIIIKNLLEKKGFLGSIIPGLKYDEAATVNLTLSLFEEKILKNLKISKTLKLKLFNTQIIKSLFDLYDWKGLQGTKQISPVKRSKTVKEEAVNQNEKEIVIESVHSFLLLLCCSQKFGVAFYDKSMGTSEELSNQLLLTVFESISDPLKNNKISEVMLKTIASCPDLMKPVLLRLEPFFQPRNSKNWFKAMEFAENLIKAMDAVAILKKELDSLTANQIIRVGKALCAPVTLLKFAKSGLEKSQLIEIRLGSLTLLTAIWAEIQRLFLSFKNFENDLKNSLYKHVHKSLPEPEELIELWHALCDPKFFSTLPFTQEKKVLSLSALLECLHMITQCRRDAVSSTLDLASDLLGCIESLKQSVDQREYDKIQIKIVQFMEIDFQAVTSNAVLFEKTLVILFQSADEASVSCLSKFLASLELFKKNEGEVDVWLLSFLSLPKEYRASVADFLIKSLHLHFKKERKGGKKKKMNINGEADIDNQTAEGFLTPFLFNCIEIFKTNSSRVSNEDQKLQQISHFLNDVVIHLQHFYSLDVFLYDSLKGIKGLKKCVLSYLKGWRDGFARPIQPEVFACPLEFDLVSWFFNDGKLQNVEKIINLENTNFLKRHSLFRTVIAFLNSKTTRMALSQNDVKKFTAVVLLFLGTKGSEDDHDNVDLISFDVENEAVYRTHCLNCLFGNKYLLDKFDVFLPKENEISYATDVILDIFLRDEMFANALIKKRLTEPWKKKFLKQLKTKLKNKESIDSSNNLEKVLNFFEYSQEEIVEVLGRLVSVSELDLFIHENAPSLWCLVLTKFITIHCQKEELVEDFVKKLCLIMEYLRKRHCSELEKLDSCFVDILRKHPKHILFIDDEFLDVIMLATNTSNKTSTLGKLLLNDPRKVRHLLNFIEKNLESLKEPQIIYSLVSSLIVKENLLFSLNKSDSTRSVWEISEISPTETPDIFNALETVYKKFKKRIIQALTEKEDESIMKNLTLTRELIKLFLGEREIKKLIKNIPEGKFDVALFFEVVKKINSNEVSENYLKGLLSLLCRIIEKSENLEEIVWEKYYSTISGIFELNKNSSWKDVVDTSEWKKFTKLALGHCLNTINRSSLLKILRLLINNFYKSNQIRDCSIFFQMLISHSQFPKVMLSSSPLKTELVELYWCLIEKCSSEMSAKHFPLLLASYTASLSQCDRVLLQILRFYEMNKVNIGDYEPFVWGNPAVSHYSIGTSSGLSLWQRFNMANVLDLLDIERLEWSLKEFPIQRSLEPNQEIDDNSNVYDPAFILPLFVNLLSPGAVVFCLPFIYKGGLAYTIRALSSECKDIRLLASLVLTRFYNHLELSQKLKQKLVWIHFINCFRFGVENLSAEPLPNIITLFFARMTLELSSQPGEMYLPLQNFLLAKPYFSFDAVPEFFPLFHSSEVPHRKYRLWLLENLRDGTKTTLDMKIIFHSMLLKVIFCFFFSKLCDIETKKMILQVIEKMLKTDKSNFLISEYSLLNWITAIDSNSFQAIIHDLLNLIYTLTGIILRDIQVSRHKCCDTSDVIQILNVAIKILPSLKQLKSAEYFKLYLKIINECFKLFIKEGKSYKNWFQLHKNSMSDIVDAGIVIMGEDYDYGKFCKVPFYFRDFYEDDGGDCGCLELKNSIFLFNVLQAV